MAPRITQAQLRDRRAKRALAGLGVVLLGVVGFQAPSLLSSHHATPAAAASPAGGASSAAPSSAQAATGQLHSFSFFGSKDPFHAQVALDAPSASAAPAAGSAKTPKPISVTGKPVAPPVAAAPPVVFKSPPPNAALIKMNGHRETVLVGAHFPASNPLFKLVKLEKKGVRISVFGGSFASGVPTLELLRGKKLTLADETDGSRYVIVLVRLTNATVASATASAPAATTTTSATTTTAAAPAGA